PFAVVRGLTPGEESGRGGCGGPCEHQEFETALVEQRGGVFGHAQVVAAQADAHVATSRCVSQHVVVPQRERVVVHPVRQRGQGPSCHGIWVPSGGEAEAGATAASGPSSSVRRRPSESVPKRCAPPTGISATPP